jgi:transposase
MRKGMATLAMLVQQTLGHDAFSGAVYAFRGRKGGLIKVLWHDGVGMCLFIKRLERGQFVWPCRHRGLLHSLRGSFPPCWKAANGGLWRAT